jgi:hypothetical protein
MTLPCRFYVAVFQQGSLKIMKKHCTPKLGTIPGVSRVLKETGRILKRHWRLIPQYKKIR